MKELFASIITLFIIGCGGGGSYSKLEDAITPTAKLQKNQTQEIIDSIVKANFLDYNNLLNYQNSSNKLTKYIANSNNTSSCDYGGSKETIIVSGKEPNIDFSEVNETSGNSVVKIIYHNCKENPNIIKDGIEKITQNWSYQKPILTYDAIYESDNMSFTKDENHKLTINYYHHNKGKVNIYSGMVNENNPNEVKINKGSSLIKYNATLINGNEKIEFRNIQKEKIFNNTTTNNDEKKFLSIKLSGALYSTKLNGWIVISTPITFEANEKDSIDDKLCYHQGKMLIKGANHTLTLEVLSNHNILLKFDDKIIKRYSNCSSYETNIKS